jgi:hypothetical protein
MAEDEHDIAPDGTTLLEPRDMYDQAYLGVVNQGGIYYAVYSRAKCIELLVAEAEEAETTDAYTDAVEHFEFNVSGSIGVGFPVFWSGPSLWEQEEE